MGWRDRLRERRGTAAIEFGFLAPVLLLLAFGIYEFGRWAWTAEALQESASSGARCIGIESTNCYSSGVYSSASTISYVQNVASGWGISIPSADITPTQSTTCGAVSGFAQVQISYQFSTVVAKLIPSLASDTLSVTSCFPVNS